MSSIFYIDIRNNPEYRFDEVLHQINHNFSSLTGSITGVTGFLSLSGGTVTGNTYFTQDLTANTLNTQVILSAGTDLYDIFLTSASTINSNSSFYRTFLLMGG